LATGAPQHSLSAGRTARFAVAWGLLAALCPSPVWAGDGAQEPQELGEASPAELEALNAANAAAAPAAKVAPAPQQTQQLAGAQAAAALPRGVILVEAPAAAQAYLRETVAAALQADMQLLDAVTFAQSCSRQKLDATSPDAAMKLSKALQLDVAISLRALPAAPVAPGKGRRPARPGHPNQRVALELVVLSLQPHPNVVLAQTYFLQAQRLESPSRLALQAAVRRAVRELGGTSFVPSEVPAPDRASVRGSETKRLGREQGPVQSWVSTSVGLGFGGRAAQLTDGVTTLRYGSAPWGGAVGEISLKVEAAVGRAELALIAAAEAALGYAPLSVVAGTQMRPIHNFPQQLGGSLRLQIKLFEHLTVAPELGYAASRFSVQDGPFPSLLSHSPTAGAQARLGFLQDRLQLTLQADGWVYIRLAEEALRLGTLQAPRAFSASVSLTYRLGRDRLGLRVGYQQLTANFVGQTFLYSPQQLTNAQLRDISRRMALVWERSL
jgi:hypothetical protein